MDAFGYKVCYGGMAHGERTVEETALRIVLARETGFDRVRTYKCTSLTQTRGLTQPEQDAIVAHAARLAIARAA